MAKRVTADNLAAEISKILDEYEGDIQDNIDVITKRIGQKGAQALRNQAQSTFPVNQGEKTSGKYEKGWTSAVEKTRVYTAVTIYNKKRAGLAHLLEFGHVSANGTGRYGRVPAYPHVAPVEQALVAEYEREVKASI